MPWINHGRRNKQASDPTDSHPESLDDTSLKIESPDIVAFIAKASFGLIPYVGSFLGEIAGNIIPNQRMDRFGKYITLLGKRLESVENASLQSLLLDNNFISLFEESSIQAVKAVSDKRREYIVSIIITGITKDKEDFLRSIHLLQILGELNDIEVLWLKWHELIHNLKYEGHPLMDEPCLQPIIKVMGQPPELYEDANIQDSYKEHLCRLGLLSHKYKVDSKTKVPEYDSYGNPVIRSHQITQLGEMLIKYIGILDD